MIIIPSFTTSLQQDAASTIPIESSLDIRNYPEISLTALNKSWYPWFSRGVNDLCLGGWLNNHDIICHGRAQWCEMVAPVVMKYCTLWSVIRVWVCSCHHISIFAITFWLSLLQTGRGSMVWFLNRKIPTDTRKMSLDSTRWPQSEMYHYTSTQAKCPKKYKKTRCDPITQQKHWTYPNESSFSASWIIHRSSPQCKKLTQWPCVNPWDMRKLPELDSWTAQKIHLRVANQIANFNTKLTKWKNSTTWCSARLGFCWQKNMIPKTTQQSPAAFYPAPRMATELGMEIVEMSRAWALHVAMQRSMPCAALTNWCFIAVSWSKDGQKMVYGWWLSILKCKPVIMVK